jgi:coatomer protein complex subunit alpha (xenin)
VAKPKAAAAASAGADAGEEGEGWGGEDEDLDLGLDLEEPSAGVGGDAAESEYFVAPTKGVAPSQTWVTSSSVIADHVAAGAFDTAMQV